MLSSYWLATLAIAAALFIGYLFVRLPIVRKSFLPGSLAAGVLVLILGPQVAGQYFPEWQLPSVFYDYWKTLPGQLINVVFACLFLAHAILPIKKIWRLAAPQAAFGQMMAWGQYALGGLAALLILVPLFSASPFSAALIEISFEGGHGTASGLIGVFEEFGFRDGHELAVGLATLSLISAIICGMLLVHWGIRRGHIKPHKQRNLAQMVYHRRVIYELRKQGISLRSHLTPKRLVLHIALIALAVFFGWCLYQVLLAIEAATWGQSGVKILGHMPMFPLCMFGGMIAHVVWKKLHLEISRPIVELLSGLALSVLIVTAIGTMSLSGIANNIETFIILAVVGIVWILAAFIFLAPRMFRKNWFQNGIVNMAQSMGQTATGLLFVKMVDPKDRTGAIESFGYKQLLFEPFVGGGIVTALAIPAIAFLGLPMFTIITGAVCITWMVLGIIYFSKL